MNSLIITLCCQLMLNCFGFIDNKSESSLEDPISKSKNVSANALIINRSYNKVVLKTSNGCGIGNFLIPCTGDTGTGEFPTIGAITDSLGYAIYTVLDTIPGTQIKGVAFKRSSVFPHASIVQSNNPLEPYIIISDTGLFSYNIDPQFSPNFNSIIPLSSIYVPGILQMASQITKNVSNPIVLLVEDTMSNYRIRSYSYPSLIEEFNFAIDFEPEIFEVVDSSLYISGWDTGGNYLLFHGGAYQDTVYAIYTLNDSASKAQEFLQLGDSLCILSSPGDSNVVLTIINSADSSLTQNVVYNKSGARATHNDYQNNKYFTFQPVSDLPSSILDKQILVLDPLVVSTFTLVINKRLDQFKYPEYSPGGFGYFSMGWLGAKWNNNGPDSIFVSDVYSTSIQTQLETRSFPNFINATWGCWVGIHENELEEINFEVFPNPALSELTINLTGLTRGIEYKLDITDLSGKILHTRQLKAYQEIILPLPALASGLYLLHLYTGKNVITQKLIIEK